MASAAPLTPLAARKIRARCTCTSLKRAARAISRAYNAAVRPSGLTVTQFEFLMTLLGHGPLRLGELACELGADATTVSRNAQLLMNAKLVQLRTADDARERVAHLTSRARRVLNETWPAWAEAQRRVDVALGATPSRRLRDQLDRLSGLI